jgi:hypothetical protein
LSPDAKLYAVRADGLDPSWSIRLLDAGTGNEVRKLIGHSAVVIGMGYSRDGQRLASCGQRETVLVWDVDPGREVARFALPELTINDQPYLSDNGRVLAVCHNGGGRNGSVLYTFDVNANVQLARIQTTNKVGGAALSPDGRLVAGGGGQAPADPTDKPIVFIWDTTTGRVVHALPVQNSHLAPGGAVCSFSPDGRLLATGDSTGWVRIWEVLSGQPVYQFDAHHTAIGSANFSPDGRLLVVASADAPCFVWDVIGTTVNPQPAAAVDAEQLWHDLSDPNARTAFLALRQLVAHPGPAVEVIRKNLKPSAGIDAARVEKLLRDLDSDSYVIHEAATAELTRYVDQIEPVLRQARDKASAEVQRRLDGIFASAVAPLSERLRQSRALATLEYIATPEAMKLLDVLAAGNKGSRLTTEAAESGQRVRQRSGK